MNILIIGNLMGSSNAFHLISQSNNYRFLYWSGRFNVLGKKYDYPNGIKLNPLNHKKQLKKIISKYDIDIIYFPTDQGMKIYRDYYKDVFDPEIKVPKVFAYHNHHKLTSERETFVYNQADGFVFLNEESHQYYKQHYQLDKPVFLIPSLYLPKMDFYDNIEILEKISGDDGEIHVAMGGRSVKCELDSEGNPILGGNKIDRYDFTTIASELSKRKIHSHIYGEYREVTPKGTKKGSKIKSGHSDEVRLAYESLAEQSKFIHLEGTTSNFESELSKYDYFICKGMTPNSEVEEFEHMNYQLRFNSAIAAKLPVLVAKGTDLQIEKEVELTGGGVVYSDFNELVNLLKDPKVMEKMPNGVDELQKRHCFDYWLDPMLNYFGEVINLYNSKAH